MPKSPKTMGKIVKSGKELVVEVNGERYPIPEDLSDQKDALEKLVDAEVEVMFSEPKPGIVAIRKPGKPPITCYLIARRATCYVPAQWMIKGVEEKVRKNLAAQMLKEGIISREVYAQIIK